VLAAVIAGSAQAQDSPTTGQPVAITNVTVIDVARGTARRGMNVVLSGDRIAAVGLAARTPVPQGARVVTGAGRFLIRGLWDMHAHVDDAGHVIDTAARRQMLDDVARRASTQ
jgi:imidazolonepropionase-like amidohydrolase